MIAAHQLRCALLLDDCAKELVGYVVRDHPLSVTGERACSKLGSVTPYRRTTDKTGCSRSDASFFDSLLVQSAPRYATLLVREAGMLERFTDKNSGRRRLEEALLEQHVVAHDAVVASELAKLVRLTEYAPNDVVIEQDGVDTELHLILTGCVAIEIHRREIALRGPHQHVGEMAMIDPSARRSATVRAKEATVVASIEEKLFAPIADRHPTMWRRLAVDLGKRLRERSALVRPTNKHPIVFVGSTVERLPIARALQTACQHDSWVTRLWTEGVFGAGKTTIESLAAQLDTLDFGLLVITADDVVDARGIKGPMPRDNMLLEFGLLMGALGRERALMVRLREERDLKLPSDLLGVNALEVVPGASNNLASRVGPAVDEFRRIVQRLGPR